MATTVKQLAAPAALSAVLTTTLYTVPAGTKVILKEILLCNTDTAASRNVTFYIGDGSSAGNTLICDLPLAAKETRRFDFSTVLEAGQTIKGGASVAAVVGCTISGVEVTP